MRASSCTETKQSASYTSHEPKRNTQIRPGPTYCTRTRTIQMCTNITVRRNHLLLRLLG
jgi:hypothetical protein